MFATFLALSVVAGFVTGLVFFGGLWWTVNRLPQSRSPYRLMAISWIVRMAVLAVVFRLLIEGAHWERGIAGLAGLLVARTLLVRRIGLTPEPAPA